MLSSNKASCNGVFPSPSRILAATAPWLLPSRDTDIDALFREFAYAVHQGNLTTIFEMLSEGLVDINGGCTPALFAACSWGSGRLNVVQALIQAGADVNLLEEEDEDTALHVLCRDTYTNVEVVKALLDAGANVNARNKYGETALVLIMQSRFCVEKTKLDVVRVLLNAKCDINVEVEGESALLHACRDKYCYQIIRLLIASGADLTKQNWRGTALLILMGYKAPNDLIKMLIEHGIDVNAKTEDLRRMALHMAALSSNIEIFQLLLENNADVLVQDNYKRTVLMNLIGVPNSLKKQEVLLVWLLLAKINVSNITAYLNLQDDFGSTAVHYATVRGRLDLIYELLSWKPDLTCKTVNEGNTALHNLFCGRLLPTDEERDILQCLLEHENGYQSNEINIQNHHGQTALHLALKWSEIIADKAILENFLHIVDVSIADETGATAIHTALYCGASQTVISALLASTQGTVAANMRNGKGKTPLHDALVLNIMDAAFAIAWIADVIVPDHDGKTALHYAIQLDEPSFMDFLLHEGNADVFL